MRPIINLQEVEMLSRRPSILPPGGGLTGSKAAGVAYEKKFGKELKRRYANVQAGKWIRFRDQKGQGLAQPDFFIPTPRMIVLFECKLSEKLEAWDQLAFYQELLSFHYGLPVAKVQVCKHLTYSFNPVRRFEDLRDRCVFHWLPI